MASISAARVLTSASPGAEAANAIRTVWSNPSSRQQCLTTISASRRTPRRSTSSTVSSSSPVRAGAIVWLSSPLAQPPIRLLAPTYQGSGEDALHVPPAQRARRLPQLTRLVTQPVLYRRRHSEWRAPRFARPPPAHGVRRCRLDALSSALWRPAITSSPDRRRDRLRRRRRS